MFLSQTVSSRNPAWPQQAQTSAVSQFSHPPHQGRSSSSRAGDLWLCYGCTPSLVASLGQTNVLSSLVMHPHHPILSRELDEHWVPILAICQNHWLLTAVYLLEHF